MTESSLKTRVRSLRGDRVYLTVRDDGAGISPEKMNSLFPLNIVIMFVIIFIAAYLTRCVARFISQTLKDAPYEWGKIVSLF